MKITDLKMIHLRPRWMFLKIETDEGITGWGEPVVEGRARTVETAVNEFRPILIGAEPARRYSNPEGHRAAGLCRPQNCRIKQKNPGGCRGSFALSCICWQRHHATPRIFSTLFRTSAGSRPEPFTLPAISCASTSAGSGSAGFAATPWMVQ